MKPRKKVLLGSKAYGIALCDEDRDLLDRVSKATGVPRSRIVARLIESRRRELERAASTGAWLSGRPWRGGGKG